MLWKHRYGQGGIVTISTTQFEGAVRWTGNQKVQVRLHQLNGFNYSNADSFCGLCGNYDGNPENDLDAIQAQSGVIFVSANESLFSSR
eukprot:m.348089 g.348089  ORF g.348089 m.348089 type:complete len:88 (+) comp35436_c0_seq1:954-1217(+)